MDFSELTIVCVTYERPKFVGRLIEYWQKNFNGAKFFIIDGSDEHLEEKYLKKINEKKINYVHMRKVSIHQRYVYIQKILKTKYFQLVADDEIFTKSGIECCLDFLEKNADYSACCGKMILFTPLLKKEVFAFSPYSLYSNDVSIKAERVKTWLAHSQPNTIYSIARSENLLKILNEYSKFDEKIFTKPEVFHEGLVEIGLAYQGKTKIIDELMWMRSVENESISLGDDKSQPEVILFDTSQKEKKLFFDTFIINYFKNLVVENDDLNLFDLKHAYYVRLETLKKNRNHKFYMNLFKLTFIKRYLFNIVPTYVKKRLRFHLNLNGPEIIEFLEDNNTNIIFDKKEIVDIKKFILNFYNDKFYN